MSFRSVKKVFGERYPVRIVSAQQDDISLRAILNMPDTPDVDDSPPRDRYMLMMKRVLVVLGRLTEYDGDYELITSGFPLPVRRDIYVWSKENNAPVWVLYYADSAFFLDQYHNRPWELAFRNKRDAALFTLRWIGADDLFTRSNET